MTEDNFQVQEEGEFGQNVPSLKEITLMHIRKISAICCNEFTKGRWEERPIKVGGGIAIARKYIPDQRAVFCNSVDFLLWVVFPMADEDFKTKYKGFKGHKKNKKGEVDWEAKLEQRKRIFKEINLMFNRISFFDTMSGQTERGK